jgi:hypothetical protein
MKTKCLAGALVACLVANPASAVSLNPKGLGQTLIYPYYTVNRNQDTLISVGNASDVGMVVWGRILEGYNGRPTQLFWILLSPHDVWTASISSIADDGGAILHSSDTSCIYPPIPEGGSPLVSYNYDGGSLPADSGPQDITRTREGFIVLIAGGAITPGSPTDLASRHELNGTPGGGVPPGCDEVTSLQFNDDVVTVPPNSLYGSASIVNVGQGTYFAYTPEAIAGFTGFSIASFASGSYADLSYANSSGIPPVPNVTPARAYVYTDDGRPVTLVYEQGRDAVSAIFMSDALRNEYLVAASLGANTDWIVTFPTKEFYTDYELYGGGPRRVTAPFDEVFTDGASNVAVAGTVFDREEGSVPLRGNPELSYQVNVVSFTHAVAPSRGTPSLVFGSVLTSLFVTPYGAAGALTLDLANGSSEAHTLAGGIDPDGNEVVLKGLPATGFMAYNIINTQAQPGMLANYGGAFGHRTTTACVGAVDACDASNKYAAQR